MNLPPRLVGVFPEIGQTIAGVSFEVLDYRGRLDLNEVNAVILEVDGSQICFWYDDREETLAVTRELPAPWNAEIPIDEWIGLRAECGAVTRFQMGRSPLITHLANNPVSRVDTQYVKEQLDCVAIWCGKVRLTIRVSEHFCVAFGVEAD